MGATSVSCSAAITVHPNEYVDACLTARPQVRTTAGQRLEELECSFTRSCVEKLLANPGQGVLAAYDEGVTVVVCVKLCKVGGEVLTVAVEVCHSVGDALIRERHDVDDLSRKAG
jgi:hypothetical protein